jgi:hypothetical protein
MSRSRKGNRLFPIAEPCSTLDIVGAIQLSVREEKQHHGYQFTGRTATTHGAAA